MLRTWSSGSLGQVSGPLRIGTTAPLVATTELVSILYTVSTNSLHTAMTSRLNIDTNTVISNTNIGNRFEINRKVTEDTTDTGLMAGMAARALIDPALTKTYTNTNASGVAGIFVNNLTRVTAGTLAISIYQGQFFFGDSTSNTGRKAYIRFGALSGGSVGNAYIADNVTYTGAVFISQTGTDPSSFGGQVRVASLGVGNSAAATVAVGALANKIEVFDASGASLGFIPVYATIT